MTYLMKYLECHIEQSGDGLANSKGDLDLIKDAPRSGRKNQQLLYSEKHPEIQIPYCTKFTIYSGIYSQVCLDVKLTIIMPS